MPNPNEPDEWFLVLKGPFYDFDDDSEEDPELTGVPAAPVRRLRELVPEWRPLRLMDDPETAHGRVTVRPPSR